MHRRSYWKCSPFINYFLRIHWPRPNLQPNLNGEVITTNTIPYSTWKHKHNTLKHNTWKIIPENINTCSIPSVTGENKELMEGLVMLSGLMTVKLESILWTGLSPVPVVVEDVALVADVPGTGLHPAPEWHQRKCWLFKLGTGLCPAPAWTSRKYCRLFKLGMGLCSAPALIKEQKWQKTKVRDIHNNHDMQKGDYTRKSEKLQSCAQECM